MNGKGRKLFRSAVGILTSVMMMGAYTTTAMASGIGVIDAKDMLDIHAEANRASAVVGQVMDDGHVAILTKYNDWVQIQAGEIAGWVPAENLVETEISNEEAVAANEQVIAERTGATASEDEFFAEEEVQQDETAALQAEASETAQNEIEEVPEREKSRLARAPQSFWLTVILNNHEMALSEFKTNFIDSCTLMRHYGARLHLIDGPKENIKITTPEDFYILRAMLDAKENEQIYI